MNKELVDVGKLRVVWGETENERLMKAENEQLEAQLSANKLKTKRMEHDFHKLQEQLYSARGLIDLVESLDTEDQRLRKEIIKGFAQVTKEHLFFKAMVHIIRMYQEQALTVASSTEAANHHGDMAHANGGAHYLRLVLDDVKKLYAEAHVPEVQAGKDAPEQGKGVKSY